MKYNIYGTFLSQLSSSRPLSHPEIPGLGDENPRISGLKMCPEFRGCSLQCYIQ